VNENSIPQQQKKAYTKG